MIASSPPVRKVHLAPTIWPPCQAAWWLGFMDESLAACPEQGYLLYFAVETSLDGGGETMAKAREVQGFGRRHGDRNLVAAGIVAEGRVLIKLGRAQEGVALLDEGMLEASSLEMAPGWAGNIYCHLMAACYELG